MIEHSIIVPTCKSENLIPCLESIRKYTDLTDTEIIVVANGYNDELPDDVRVVFHNQMIGYPAAINEGAKVAQGEYLILLNDDTILLEQYKNCWIDTLKQPFEDKRTAVSGPWMNWCPWAEHDFLIFFCVMIRKSVFDQLGGLDAESFGAGYGEDADFCCKAEAAGFRTAQVPTQEKLGYDGRMALGQFPIYHAGNKTFANWPGGEELLRKNRAILHERYGTNIGNAHNCDGYMADTELRWLAQRARQSKVVIEIGSWHGKSSRAIADNLPPGGKLYCCDTWNGSAVEQDTNHASAKLMDGDHAFDEFCRNNWEHISSGRLVPLRMHGCHAAHLLLTQGVAADLIFIDGGHAKGETKADIEAFLPLLKKGGIIAGHDFKHTDFMWPDVTLEVLEIFGKNVGQPDGTNIWYTDSIPNPPRPRIYDCFMFGGEREILHRRIMQLANVVDRFVITEATKTHSGKPRELIFEKCYEVIPYSNQITYVVVDDLPEVEGTVTDKSWARERAQRDALMRGLTDCRDTDLVIISDLDEIPSAKAIQSFNGCNEMRCFSMKLKYYNTETLSLDEWKEAKILRYGLLKQHSPCWARYEQAPAIPNGGEHLSYFGGVEAIQRKIENTAHQEYNTEYFKNPDRIKRAIENGTDIFERDHITFVKCETNSSDAG